MRRKFAPFIVFTLLCIHLTFADNSDVKVTPSGFVYYQFGQLQKTYDPTLSGWKNKSIDQRTVFRLALDAKIQERLHIIVGTELAMVLLVGASSTPTYTSYMIPKEGQGIYTFGSDPSSANPPLQIALGYFPFKYNAQAANMGEYLFRSGTYLPYILNDFENCQARLLGLHVSSTLLDGKFRQDILFTNETYFQPVGDYTLSYLAGYKAGKILDVGAGISLNRILPVDKNLTTTKDTVFKNNQPVYENGKILYYTFQGVKLMARASLDIKQLDVFNKDLVALLGPEDGKIYTEAAILGVKNYGFYFDDIMKRSPIMVGFNVPAFKVLDILSLEMEYCGFAYDVYKLPTNGGSLTSGMSTDRWSSQNMFHWSMLAEKTIAKGLTMKGLIGKDHYRSTDGGGNPTPNSPTGEMLIAQNDWHYVLRLMYSF
jgi:hypothetical protein